MISRAKKWLRGCVAVNQRTLCLAICFLVPVILVGQATAEVTGPVPSGLHPRLYFQSSQLPELRQRGQAGMHAWIWENIIQSADWCAAQPVRTEWIPTLADDPQYENLYDRFYAAMSDLAVVEHLAFASVLSDPQDDPYFAAARDWLLATARIWQQEKENSPDASKAYAVLRVMKGVAVAYDLLYPRLTPQQRDAVRQSIIDVGTAYFEFFKDPVVAGAGYNKHHGSVDAPPLGIMALTLLEEFPESQQWLDLVLEKHVDYLLPHALTVSGTNEQSSNFWASTLQYRIMFLEALRHVTGRDLAGEFPQAYPGRIALAAVAAGQPADLQFNDDNRSILFGPSYGQINYWAPVLVFLARNQQRPIYQHLASWDHSLGSLQRTRYVTPNKKEELLFCLGPYAYLWCDTTVPAAIEPDLPLSFVFPEPEVNEAYMRSSYKRDGIVVGLKKGGIIVHAGGRPVMVDQLGVADINDPKAAVEELLVADDGVQAMIRCVGPESSGLGQQVITLHRPARLCIDRELSEPLTWIYSGDAKREGQSFVWSDGTRLTLTGGKIASITSQGYRDAKVHYAGMQYADPHPFEYPTVVVEPEDGRVTIEVTTPVVQKKND